MKRKISILSPAFIFTGVSVFAQDGGAAATKGETNWLEVMLVLSAIVLLLVIWGLGQVLLTLSRQAMDKRKKDSGMVSILIILFLLSGQSVLGQTSGDSGTVKEFVPNYGGLSATEFFSLAGVIALETVVIFFLAAMIRRMHRELTGAPEPAYAAPGASRLSVWWKNLDKRIFTRAVPVEKEADVLLDHDYDGIRELDNALPPWWKYGFYFTIVVAVIYIFNFHVWGLGKSPEQEYAAEMNEGRLQEELYKARTINLVDENNISMADADGIAQGKTLFAQSCTPCHGQAGEGGIGPNLTDKYWLHGGSMNDIYKTIKIGYPDKGMQSWQALYSPVQIKNLTSFVKSLHGTNPPNAKAPQGEEYTEQAAEAKPIADSTAK